MQENKLPKQFQSFLNKRKWKLFDFQKEFLENCGSEKYSQILISSDTGTGKTITLFLPTIIDAINNKKKKIIYICPLKSIISDLYENIKIIIDELGLNITIGKRTGDESSLIKKEQLNNPCDIILTTPESLALMIAKRETDNIFKSISFLAIDELNEIVNTKRGDQLILAMSHVISMNKKIKIFSCSSSIENYEYLSNWLSLNGTTKIITNKVFKNIKLKVFYLDKIPDYGHGVDYAIKDLYEIVKNKKTIIFVNTRAQAEILFKSLFINFKDLKIGIYHSSLSKKIRNQTERNFKENKIDSIISTSSLEMGIDWKNIDKILNIGAPKSVNKIIQRLGRSNHSHSGVSDAVLIPTNKFEYLECIALEKLIKNKEFDTIFEKNGAKDVLCQHLLLISCHSSFYPDKIYRIITKAYPYRNLKKEELTKLIEFIYNGGYVLENYKNLSKLKKLKNGSYRVKNENLKKSIFINVGTIIDSSNIKIKTTKGNLLGTVEDNFLNTLKEKDSFIFAGMTLVCRKISNNGIIVDINKRKSNKVPIYWGGSMQLKSNLSNEILNIFKSLNRTRLPKKIKNFILFQKNSSGLPEKNKILIESFPYKDGEYLFFHTFLGREANQTLSNMLISYLDDKQLFSLNYIINDYSFGLFFRNKTFLKINDFKNFFNFHLKKINSLDTAIAKRIFKEVSMISGLTKKNNVLSKYGSNNFVNSDIIFDTLRKYEPEHIILKITKEEIDKHFVHHSQIDNLKQVDFKHVKLKSLSEFSKALINEKEKIKINSPL